MFLSLIIPVYNTKEKFLRQCIESCLKQNMPKYDYEIICVDDGSNTACIDIIKEYKEYNSNLILLSQKNSGVSVARNNGLLHAKGKYVWFVDSDDFIQENCLPELKKRLISNSVIRLNLGAFHFVNSINGMNSDNIKPNHALRSIFCTRSLYNKSFLLNHDLTFNSDITLGEDMLFNFELDQIDHIEDSINRVFYFYRITDDSLSHGNSNSDTFFMKFIDNHLIACRIVKSYYLTNQHFATIRYLHGDIAQMMIYISKLRYPIAKKYLISIVEEQLFPYLKNWFSKGFLVGVYTNFHSAFLSSVCNIARLEPLFFIIKVWAILWNSKAKKRIEKNLKRKVH